MDNLARDHFTQGEDLVDAGYPEEAREYYHLALELAREKLDYAYLGNIEIAGAGDTCCPQCGQLLVERSYYRVRTVGIGDGRCQNCNREVDISL